MRRTTCAAVLALLPALSRAQDATGAAAAQGAPRLPPDPRPIDPAFFERREERGLPPAPSWRDVPAAPASSRAASEDAADPTATPRDTAAPESGTYTGTGTAPRAPAPRTWRVGPDAELRTIAEAARTARDGDIVEIAPGEYRADVAVWNQRRLTIRAAEGAAGASASVSGGRPRVRLVAAGAAAEGKAIWVFRRGEISVEGIEFSGARVASMNGAGIRVEGGKVVLRDCRFVQNENGILVGNNNAIELDIERCQFVGNGAGDGYSHNLYAGRIARLSVQSSFFSAAKVGHLLKSRARENLIAYNRLTDDGGNASYELEIADGGIATLIGNLIVQEADTGNSTIVSYGAESHHWPENRLTMVNNTVVNRRPTGAVFLRALRAGGEVALLNNLWVGSGLVEVRTLSKDAGNAYVEERNLRAPAKLDFVPRETAALRSALVDPRSMDLPAPTRQYVHPASSVALGPASLRLPGAFQR